jgi:hypothetical protein
MRFVTRRGRRREEDALFNLKNDKIYAEEIHTNTHTHTYGTYTLDNTKDLNR